MVKRVLNFIILEPSLHFTRSPRDSRASVFAGGRMVRTGEWEGNGKRRRRKGKNNDLSACHGKFLNSD